MRPSMTIDSHPGRSVQGSESSKPNGKWREGIQYHTQHAHATNTIHNTRSTDNKKKRQRRKEGKKLVIVQIGWEQPSKTSRGPYKMGKK